MLSRGLFSPLYAAPDQMLIPFNKLPCYTLSSLWVPYASTQESGPYQCIPSNTGPASINVHVLDGK